MLERQESGRSLREAVEELAADWRSLPHDPDSIAAIVIRHHGAQLALALADHPVDPARMPTREQVERALRERLQNSNFSNNLHEPIRTQVIDQWVDVLAGTVMSLFDSTTSTKGETQS